MYYNQVKQYLANFSNTRVYLFEDLYDRNKLLTDIFKFLSVSPEVTLLNYKKYNISGYPRNKYIHAFLTQDNLLKKLIRPITKTILLNKIINSITSYIKSKNLESREMSKQTREQLKERLGDDIHKLSKLIDRDLSHWLS